MAQPLSGLLNGIEHLLEIESTPSHSVKHVLALLGGVHLIVSLATILVGTSPFFKELHNGQGIWNFALDSITYQGGAFRLCDILQHQGWRTWLTEPARLHEKLYSIPYYLFDRSAFSIILVNTPLYLLTVWLVYLLGKRLFNERVGLGSMIVVALIPSYLIQSMQLLRDMFVFPAQLLFLCGWLLLLKGKDSPGRVAAGVLLTAGGYFGITAFKSSISPLYYIIEVLASFILLGLWVKKRPLYSRQLLASLLVLCASYTIDKRSEIHGEIFLGKATPQEMTPTSLPRTLSAAPSTTSPTPPQKYVFMNFSNTNVSRVGFLESYVKQICNLREGYRRGYAAASSNIDTNIVLRDFHDILRYAPRALFIGLAAPFPLMWFSEGQQTGRIGRIVSGLEMTFMYGALLLACGCLWKERSNPVLWLLAVYILLGLTLHALIITNLGSLYRFRYIYWFVIVILALRTIDVQLASKAPRASTPHV